MENTNHPVLAVREIHLDGAVRRLGGGRHRSLLAAAALAAGLLAGVAGLLSLAAHSPPPATESVILKRARPGMQTAQAGDAKPIGG
jgi:hypothetical protein